MGEASQAEQHNMPEKRIRSRVKVVSKPSQLEAELQKASDRLVVLEFFSETISPCRKMQPAIAAMSLEHTSAVFIKANIDIWEEIEDFLPRFNCDPGQMHAKDGNPNVYIDPSKKLVMYAHVKSSDTVLQRYNVVGLPTVHTRSPCRGCQHSCTPCHCCPASDSV